jgi:DNA replication and repair protein RecF
MILKQVAINNFRNLSQVKLDLDSGFNIFYGDNGSGKTSLLEALFYLGTGRSFRSPLVQRIIMHNRDHFLLFGLTQDANKIRVPIGIKRFHNGIGEIRIAGQTVDTRAQLAELLPLQLINSYGYRLLEAGPRYRRQFMDWGMFHVEHSFLSSWRQVQRILKQRNAALRQNQHKQIRVWDDELVSASNILHKLREQYVQTLIPILAQLLTQLLEQEVILEYYPGWNLDKPLSALLTDRLAHDLQLGYTSIGPQKADLHFKVNKIPAQDILSRGQQKLLICALQLAQGLLLQQQTHKNCIYLIDDLPSELDKSKQQRVVAILRDMHAQAFITGINQEGLQHLFPKPSKIKMFHVEHGDIDAI